MMEVFKQLGAEVESLWRDKNYNEELFPALAADALRRAELPVKVSAWEILDWALRQDKLPKQMDPVARFGDPPITLFNSSRFYIDAYFWLNGTTSIHQHAFCGAFQVLLGSSIHSWYEFQRSEAINVFMELGEISVKLCELLAVGDVKEIRPGRQYIHSLFHLDQPSVTIVVRTGNSPLHLPQYKYLKPRLALDSFFEDETTTKKIQSIAALVNSNHTESDRMIAGLLETADFQTSFAILTSLQGMARSNALEEVFNLDAPQNRYEKFLKIVRDRHGAKAEVFADVFAHREFETDIVRRRSYVTDPEHRFFLALILNIEGRERIFSLIKQRFPDAEPLDKVLDWTFDLANTRIAGSNIPNALGIENFDEGDLLILELLLKGETAEKIESQLREQKAEIVLRDLDARIAKIREAVMFGPLLSERGVYTAV